MDRGGRSQMWNPELQAYYNVFEVENNSESFMYRADGYEMGMKGFTKYSTTLGQTSYAGDIVVS